MQFTEIVEILQDELDGVYASNEDDDNNDDELDGSDGITNKTKVSSSSSPSTTTSTTTSKSTDQVPEEDADDWNDIDDMKEIAREIYDELREDSPSLSIANFKKWEDVKDLIATKAISSAELDEAIKKVGVIIIIIIIIITIIIIIIIIARHQRQYPSTNSTSLLRSWMT